MSTETTAGEIAGRLHFAGDIRARMDQNLVGPGEDGRVFRPVMTEYDEAADVTTVHYEEA
ncbi:hypothetical protein [Isoptericola sp. NPDC056605]|uniref:hypothetical protein n=1 Tax=Isoptericola sp. NPDC056605 TaxID=3345876 RepID=UPI0036993719